MTRRRQTIVWVSVATGLAIAVAIAATQLVQTAWFRDYVKQKLISAAEQATGGRVEVGSFDFDPRHLRVVVTGLVIHGSEPAGVPPFLQVPRIEADIRLLTSIHHILSVSYLGVEQPVANIIVLAGGKTNMPQPRKAAASGEPPLQSIVDAAIGRFDLNQATIAFADQKDAFSLHADNFRAQLWFNTLQQTYRGELFFQPLYTASGRNARVSVKVTLPVTIGKDSVTLSGATIATRQTAVRINAVVGNLKNPQISAQIAGRIALEDLKNIGDLPLITESRGLPATVELDADAKVSSQSIQVSKLQLGLGQSNFQASGTLKGAGSNAPLRFRAQLALSEIAKLLRSDQNPQGSVSLDGTAKLDAANNYAVDAALTARKISVQEGPRRIGDLDLTSALSIDPHMVALNNLRVNTPGGVLEASASLENFERYQFHGNLQNFTVQSILNLAGEQRLPYSGAVQGPIQASGNLKDSHSLRAQINLAISPGKSGIPVSGRLSANYDSAADDVRVENSYLYLPHSRLNVSGSASRELDVSLVTTDPNEILAVMGRSDSSLPLKGRPAEFTGTISGGLFAARLAGHLRTGSFRVEGRMFDSLSLDASASPRGASVEQGTVTRGTMQIQFSGRVGMNQWKVMPQSAIHIESTIRNSDLADLLALAGQPVAGTSGVFDASVHLDGSVGNPTGSASLMAANGTLHEQPFDRIQAQLNLGDRLITIPNASAEEGNSRLSLSAEFHHARNSITTGQLHVGIHGSQIDLAKVAAIQRERPGTGGELELNADATGDFAISTFQLGNGTANAVARNLQFEGQNYGGLTLNAHGSGQDVRYEVTSTFAGSNIRVTGDTDLQQDYKTSLDASISNLPVERVLAVARRRDIPAKGLLSATAHVSGTKDAPTGNVDLRLTNAVLYQEPIERLEAKASYEETRASIEQLRITAPGGEIGMTAQFDHPKDNLQSGEVQLQLDNSRVDLVKVRNLQIRRPGIGGMLRISASGTAELHAGMPFTVQKLQASIAANEISMQGKNLGDASLTASTQSSRINFNLTSDLAGASIQVHGNAELASGYPVDAQLTFNKVDWANLQPFIRSQDVSQPSFDAGVDGEILVRGALLKPEELSGSLRLTRVELDSTAGTNAVLKKKEGGNSLIIKNTEPVSLTLDAGNLRIESAHLSGAQTDIQASGTMSLKSRSMNLAMNANSNLAVLESLDHDISSSGSVVVAATVRGTTTKPAVNGTVQFKDVTVNYTGVRNGISNANGTVEFNGSTASLRSFTTDTGGGKLTLTGYFLMAEHPRFDLRANANQVRVDVQQGISVVANARLDISGTPQANTVRGGATITRVNYAPKSDLGAILARSAPPAQTGSGTSFLDNMKLDLQITTSDALKVQSALAQSLEGTANLRVQGTASHPTVLGRVTVTQGTLTFFGNSYTVNTGTVSFYNPVSIEPVLDASLETNVEGVDVTLHITGPIEDLKLSYTSDPPLQFQEIIGLLAVGQTPTTDPTLVANNPPLQQGLTQMGESAVLGQAIANPVANRLQRVFGVTQLKISPEYTTGSSTPQTTLTLQQQVASNVTFTYITQADNANAETIRIDVTLNPQWSASAMRDENGIFSINLLYKRQFR